MDSIIHWIWSVGINYLLYGLLILSALWTSKHIMLTAVKNKYTEWNYKYRIRKLRSKAAFAEAASYKNPILRHLNLLIKTTSTQRNEFGVEIFLILSSMLGVFSSLFMLIAFGDIFVALLFGILLCVIPYLILKLKLNKIRYKMNNEFLSIVQKLTQNYNAAHYDMYHALSETQKEIQSAELRKVIVKLVSDLQVSRNETELRESIQVFTYTAGTNWAKRLGSIILKAYLYDEKVLNALMVLTKQMEDTEKMLEEEQSQTMDSVYDGYLTLPLFIGSIILGYYSSGAQNWVNLQFGSQWTILLFSICLVGVVFSIIISAFLKRPKNDL